MTTDDRSQSHAAKRNLGRGLAALFGEEGNDLSETPAAGGTRTLPVGKLRPGSSQPRHNFDEEALQALVDSVREKGVLQPLLVRKVAGTMESYEIVAGERRWRAAQLAKVHEVPVIVRDLSDSEALEIALVENIQRQDLTPLEEAEGYKRLMDEFAHSQADLGRAVGKSRAHVANMLRLLGLPEPVKQMLDDGSLSAGHARALLSAEDRVSLAKEVVRRGLNVRQTERLVAKARSGGARGRKGAPARAAQTKDADTLALERELTNSLGLKVSIELTGEAGALTVRFESLEQLDDVAARLRQAPARPESFN